MPDPIILGVNAFNQEKALVIVQHHRLIVCSTIDIPSYLCPVQTFHDDPETVAEIVSQMEDLGLGAVKRAAPYNFGVGKR